MRGLASGEKTMRSVASGCRLPFIHLVLVALLPAGVFAAQGRSSMAVSVRVVHGNDSTAAQALMDTLQSRDSAGLAANSEAACKTIDNTVVVDGVWATCSWDPESRLYLLTVQY